QRNCDRVMWLDKGVVREIGKPKEVVDHYRATVQKPKKRRRLALNKTEADIKDKAIIRAENVGLSFELNTGTFWALKNLDFEIKEGEVVGIIGHNGAGKSTLCKVLTNILKPDEGEIEINGETSSLLGYGTGFNPQLTGRDNIFLNEILLGIYRRKEQKKINELVRI